MGDSIGAVALDSAGASIGAVVLSSIGASLGAGDCSTGAWIVELTKPPVQLRAGTKTSH
jgi:hypothetical protein